MNRTVRGAFPLAVFAAAVACALGGLCVASDSVALANPLSYRVEDTSSTITYAWSTPGDNWVYVQASTDPHSMAYLFHPTSEGSQHIGGFYTGSSCTYTFAGSQISWITTKGANRGIAAVYIDGVLDTTVDLYDPAAYVWQVPVYTKTFPVPGVHTIQIRGTGTKNPLSSGTALVVDAFDVQ